MDYTQMIQLINSSGIIAIVVVTWIISQSVKQIKRFNNEYISLFSLGLGLVVGVLVGLFTDVGVYNGIIDGVIAGWAASGGHDSLETIYEKFLKGVIKK